MILKFVASSCLLAITIPCIALAQGSSDQDARLFLDVPFSLVETWKDNNGYSFPKDPASMNRQQILAIQHYLRSRTYDIPATGVWDKGTREALSQHQGSVSKGFIAKEVVKNINDLYSFLYCPVGQTSEDISDYRLENVNKQKLLPSAYTPNNLRLEDGEEVSSNGPVCLETETYDALLKMYKAAKDDGVNLYVTSSYRGEDFQDYLLKVMIKRYGNMAYRIVALPGQSEHNLGTSVDFAGFEGGKRIPVSAGSQFAWLEKHAVEYGFVNSYPVGKEKITGFEPEPWHWRFVGVPIALSVKKQNITLTEFLSLYGDSLRNQTISYRQKAQSLLKEVIIGG